MVSLAAVAPLRSRDFRLFWFGQWVSQWGDNVFMVAQIWLVYALTGSPAALVTIALCSQIPGIGMLLLGGALVDRLPRRLVALWSEVLRGAMLLLAAGLQITGRLQPLHLYALAAAFGLISAFARPAFRALVQALAPPEHRAATNSLVSGGSLVAGMAGPALGGMVLAAGGAGLAFAVNGLSFFAAAVGLLLARPPEPGPAGEAALDASAAPAGARRGLSDLRLVTLLGDLLPALRLLAARRFLIGTVFAMALIQVTGQAPVVILRPWVADQRASGGAGALSLAYTCFAAGMGLTVVALGSIPVRRRRGLLVYGGMFVAGICELAMARVTAPWQQWTAELILGAAVMIHGVIWETLLQEHVPPAAMGRVAAISDFGSAVLYPGGVALVGLLSVAPGPQWVLLGGGTLTALVAVLGLLTPWVRREA